MAREFLARFIGWIRKHRRIICVASGIVVITGYAILFIIPKNIQFSYSQPISCIDWPTILPTLHSDSESSDSFKVRLSGEVKIAGLPIMAKKICVEPTKSPKPGSSVVSIAPFGWWGVFRHYTRVTVPDAPRVSTKAFAVPVASTNPLTIELSRTDKVYDYTLLIGEKVAKCTTRFGRSSIDCDLPSMELEQGKTYPTEIRRSFKDSKPITAARADLTTLTATTVIASSIAPDEIIYSKPTEFTFTADKLLTSAKASIVQDSGAPVDTVVTTAVEGVLIKIHISKELPRDKAYTISVDSLEAIDGSSLAEPYKLSFRTSGGPKVINVSIGGSGVSASASVVVTFDQELSADQDMGRFVAISGGNARITKNGRQLIYSLNNMGLCAPFTLSVAKGVQSKYGIAGADGWAYSSRTVCHTTSVYGYSVGGRALIAYSFGSAGPIVMYVGAIHGNESSSRGLMYAWIDDLEANPGLYSGKRVVVVPSINPDGIAVGTRTNARGVNLNRNFPTDGWTADINDTDGTHVGGGGSAPLSEPEASALANFTMSLRPRLLLSFHAVGSFVTGDYGGYSAPYASRYASMVGYRDATGQGGTFDYDITGAYEDWTYSKQGIPSMVVELGSYGYFNFPHHRSALRAMLD